MLKRFLTFVLVLTFLLSLSFIPTTAEFIHPAEKVDITISGTGYSAFNFLKDGNIKTYKTSNDNCAITIESENEIYSLYFMFDLEYGEYTITDNTNNTTITAGKNSFLHEYVKLKKPSKSLTVNFTNGAVRLSEITAYSYGSTPAGVQDWSTPLDGKTDILLLATHGDDDQLFFAGLFPLYAAERQCAVQVAYLTDHRNLTKGRTHEMLNGLWATGVTAYPVFGKFADFRIDDLQGTYDRYAQLGTNKDELQAYVVEQIRRFKPQVVVGHDFNGEYGHGMHKAYTDLLVNSLELTSDKTQFTESAEKYGVWDIPKTYIHLYKENPIVIDYDSPLKSFEGLTAFQVTQKYGYPCHESQQYTWFTNWLNGNGNITTAKQITKYNPCEFGLYRTTVGEDIHKNDFMENITKYADKTPQKETATTLELAPEKEKNDKKDDGNKTKKPDNDTLILIVSIIILVIATVALGFIIIKRIRK